MTGSHCFILLLAIADWAAVVLAEGCAVWLRNFFVSETVLRISWLNFWVIFPAIFLLFFAGNQLYTRRRPFYKETERIFYACLFAVAAIVFLLYVTQIAATTSRLFVVLFLLLVFPICILTRYGAKKYLQKSSRLQMPVLVIGAGKTAALLLRAMTEDIGMTCRIVGFLEDRTPAEGIAGHYPILGRFDDVEKVIRETKVAHVIIAAPGLPEKDLAHLIYRVQPLVKNLCVIPNLVGVAMGSVEIESLFEEKLVLLRLKNNLNRLLNRIVKRIFDLCVGIMIAIPASLIIAVTYVLIKIDSKGPVFYNAERLGKNGKLFKCYKLRSMYINADEILSDFLKAHPDAKEEWKEFQKLRGEDPRVTKVGKWIRKYSIDELPQIFNVLGGSMSLVGPRPYLPREREKMGPWFSTICMTVPGITGLWQVSGRNDVTFEDRLRMDAWYIRNWNLWQDVVILFKTVKVVLGKGAY